LEIQLKDFTLSLLPEKALMIQKSKTLVIADLHIGKITHFRNAGISLPHEAKNESLNRLKQIVHKYKPKEVIILGDLFHSTINEDWVTLTSWIKSSGFIVFKLVLGNHDILPIQIYADSGLQIYTELYYDRIWFTHQPMENIPKDYYNISGHIHPCVTLKGKGKQRLRLACFHIGPHQAVLPAFGHFTGMYPIKASEGDHIYVIAENEVYLVNK